MSSPQPTHPADRRPAGHPSPRLVRVEEFRPAEFLPADDLEAAFAAPPVPHPTDPGPGARRDSRSPATAAAGDALEEFAPYPAPPGTVASACTCPDPQECSCAGQGYRPRVAPQPVWNVPKLGSPVERTLARLQRDRDLGVLPGAEPGQGIGVLPYLTDHELGAWTQALLAEHHRRQCQFADYRSGAQQQGRS
jgi:hypothetical protein